jgi:hypothetical protein
MLSLTIKHLITFEEVNEMNVKYLFDYVEQCQSKNVVANWQGLRNYYEKIKGGFTMYNYREAVKEEEEEDEEE